jgi:hypothetical protein
MYCIYQPRKVYLDSTPFSERRTGRAARRAVDAMRADLLANREQIIF